MRTLWSGKAFGRQWTITYRGRGLNSLAILGFAWVGLPFVRAIDIGWGWSKITVQWSPL